MNSALWHRFVEQGQLTGGDALPVERQDPIDVARIVVEDALREENDGLIAGWYYLIAPYLMVFEGTEETRNRLSHHPSLLRIKQLFSQTSAHSIELDSPLLRRPAKPEALVDEDGNPLELLTWWYQTT